MCYNYYHIADDLGFDQLSVEPVIADPCEPYAITEEDLPVIFEEYEKLAVEMVRRKKEGRCFNFFHFMIDLDQGPCAIKRLRGCGCGNEYVSVTPDGDIYPCHQFVGNDEWKMGSLDDEANNYCFNKDINKPVKLSCEMERKRVECAIMIKVAMADK
ncbi:MAG: SPASM domain-containing protein [Oscillospiraceae bacterium]|nr:SPASM domain-containing protein [Oscillospiraceae bacterium]